MKKTALLFILTAAVILTGCAYGTENISAPPENAQSTSAITTAAPIATTTPAETTTAPIPATTTESVTTPAATTTTPITATTTESVTAPAVTTTEPITATTPDSVTDTPEQTAAPESTEENSEEEPPQELQRRLPCVYISIPINVDEIDREKTTEMTFAIDCTNSPEYTGIEECTGKIRGRGNSTWTWEKKPYKIKLDEKASVLGLAPNKDWILLANYADKSLMRNTVAYEMAKELDSFEWTPTQIPVDLYINGEYRGVYSIGEHLETGKSRIDLNFEPYVDDTDYLFEVGGADEDDVVYRDYFNTNADLIRFIKYKEPAGKKLSYGQRVFVLNLFNKAEEAIIAKKGYEEYIDVDSFCDWLIIHELTNNTDSMFRRSCFISKRKGGKLKMGPVWDFDLAFGNYVIDDPYYNSWVCIGSDEEDAWVRKNWFNYLMEDGKFRAALKKRWYEVKDRLLSAAYRTIDYNAEIIYPSQTENFRVWDIWDIKAGYSSWSCYAANTYEKQTEYLKNFIARRAAWIDANI